MICAGCAASPPDTTENGSTRPDRSLVRRWPAVRQLPIVVNGPLAQASIEHSDRPVIHGEETALGRSGSDGELYEDGLDTLRLSELQWSALLQHLNAHTPQYDGK